MQIARDKLEEAAEVLGLSFMDFENLTLAALNEAFYAAAREHHPDRGGDGEAWLVAARARDLIKAYLGR